MTRAILASVLSIILASGCGSEQKGTANQNLAYTTRTIDRSVGTCNDTTSGCAKVRLQYPEFINAATARGRDSLNKTVADWILARVLESGVASAPDSVASEFLRGFSSFIARFPDSRQQWMIERTVSVINDTLGIATLRYDEFSYTGGAHPNSTRTYANIDLTTGRKLTLAEITKAGAMERLVAVGETEFRRLKQLATNASLDQAGFWFTQNRFRLNDNFAIAKRGIIFYYNSYEIAPYAMGPTELLIPYSKLSGIISFLRR
jgi:hypothetical protein